LCSPPSGAICCWRSVRLFLFFFFLPAKFNSKWRRDLTSSTGKFEPS
jgi:hypothetical protein